MKKLRILFTGVGGQGTLLASRLLGEAALFEDIPVRVSEVHGMSQRGGVVESTVMLGGIESPLISDGEADVLIGFEPIETFRALKYCSRSTLIITNTAPITPFTVKLGMAAYPDVPKWIEFLKANFKRTYSYDADVMAKKAGSATSTNVVMLGTLIGTGITGISPERMRETIKTKLRPNFIESNLNAFELGFRQVDQDNQKNYP